MRETVFKNRWFVVVLMIEMVLLGIVGVKNISAPGVNYIFSGEMLPFSYETSELVSVEEDGSYTITSDNWALEADAWQVRDVVLPAGVYKVRVNYHATGVLTGECNTRITIDSRTTRNYYSGELLEVRNDVEYVEKYIQILHKTDDLSISVHYGGLGRLNIKSIEIKEVSSARWGRFVEWIALFVIFDILALALFDERIYDSGKRQRIFVFAVTTAFASLPMISDMLLGGHDLYFHLGRIEGIAGELKAGHFPVRIYHSAYNGYGYANSVFYGEIFLYIPAVLHLIGIPLYRTYQIYVVLINAVTYLVAYKCFGGIFSSKKIGTIGAILYTCAHYRIVCIYTRAAVGEYSAMMFFPLVLYGMWRILFKAEDNKQRKDRYAWVWLAVAMTGIIQTHILSVEMVGIFLVIVCVIFVKKILKKDIIVQLVKAALTTVLVNLWFLVPFFEYMRGDYKINNGSIDWLNYSGLYIAQIFGGFFKAGGKNQLSGMAGEMPLGIGLALGVGLMLFLVVRVKWGENKSSAYYVGRVMLVLTVIAIWFSSIYFPWDSLREMNNAIAQFASAIQFPWRYLAIATICAVGTIVAMLSVINDKQKGSGVNIAGGIIIGLSVLIAGYYYSDYCNTAGEMTEVCKTPAELQMDTLYLPSVTNKELMSVTTPVGNGVVISDYNCDSGISALWCESVGEENGDITLPNIYYPNFVAYDAENNPLQTEIGNNGCVNINVPQGFDGEIIVKYIIPVHWRVAEWISVLSMMVLLFLCAKQKKK